MWTDDAIMSIIKCDKRILKKPKKAFEYSNRQWRNQCTAQSSDGQLNFDIFARYLEVMPEDFSVGLKMDTPNPFCDKAIILIRFQGPHGGYVEDQLRDDLHNNYHIHILSAADANNRIYQPKKKLPATDYSNFPEAVVSFCKFCNVPSCEALFLTSYNEQFRNQIPGQIEF